MGTDFWVQMLVYGVSFGTFAGTVTTKLNNLEKKQDKHNNLIERMTVVEQSAKSAHRRLDEKTKEK